MDTKIQELTRQDLQRRSREGERRSRTDHCRCKCSETSDCQRSGSRSKTYCCSGTKTGCRAEEKYRSRIEAVRYQAVEALKSEVVNLITGKITSSNVKAIVSDTAFMQKVILEMAKEWAKKEAITIQTADADALTKYFEANAKSLLDGGVKIEKVSGKNAGFTIVPADGSYKVSFGEDEFVAFFKEFLRPGLVEMLF